MIEWHKAKSNLQVPFVDGKALASTIDPLKEAESWASRLVLDLYKDTENVIVLGVGAGYHIDSLLKQSQKKIIAIDFYADFIVPKKSSGQVKYILIEENNNFAFKNILKDLVGTKSQVFLHGPSTSPLKSAYFLLRDEINLRTEKSIKDFEHSDGNLQYNANIKLIVDEKGYVDFSETLKNLHLKSNKNIYFWKILGEILT